MGDRTSMRAVIYDCPPENAGLVLDALNEYFGRYTGDGEVPADFDAGVLTLFAQHETYETSVGNSAELSSALQEISGVAFEVSEDPKYEFLGDVHCYVPSLGYWHASAESGGGAVFTGEEILKWFDTDLSREQIQEKLGQPWTTALAALEAEAEVTTLTRIDEED